MNPEELKNKLEEYNGLAATIVRSAYFVSRINSRIRKATRIEEKLLDANTADWILNTWVGWSDEPDEDWKLYGYREIPDYVIERTVYGFVYTDGWMRIFDEMEMPEATLSEFIDFERGFKHLIIAKSTTIGHAIFAPGLGRDFYPQNYQIEVTIYKVDPRVEIRGITGSVAAETETESQVVIEDRRLHLYCPISELAFGKAA